MWQRIMARLFGQVGPIFVGIFGKLTDQKTFDGLLELARTEVGRLAGRTDLAGAQKQSKAAASILDLLKAAGKQLAPVLINLAIELAVAELQAQAAKK